MSLNFSGLGFTLAARDVGLTSTLTQAQTQFTALNDLLGSLATATTTGLMSSMEKLTSSLDAALAPAKQSIENVSKSVGALGDKLKTLTPSAQQASAGVQKAAEGLQQSAAKVTVEPAKQAVDDLADSSENLNEQSKETSVGWHRVAGAMLGGAGMIAGGLGWIGLALGPVIAGFGAAVVGIGGLIERAQAFPQRIGERIHSLATEGINLTNSLEGEAVGLGQTARQIGAGLGFEGERLNQFIGESTSMAMRLNIGADEAANALYAWSSAADELGAMGFRSATEVARLNASLGVSSENLYQYLQGVRALGMAPDLVERMSGAFGTMGQRTGFATNALEQMQDLLAVLRQRRAVLGSTPEQLTQFATSTAAATEVLYAMGGNFEVATTQSTALANSLTESSVAFRNLFSGVGDGIPEFVSSMSIVGGDVDRAFTLMQGGPAELIQGIGLLVDETRRQGGDVGALLNGLAARMDSTLGEAGSTIIASFRSAATRGVRPAMDEIVQAVTQGTFSYGELANRAHTTGRTLQETFDRMKEQAETAFRAIARPEAAQFVRDAATELGNLRRSLRDAASAGSLLQPVLTTMSLAGQIGGLALLPRQLRGSAIAANQMYEQAQPLIQAFTSFGGIMDTVGSYVALFITRVTLAKNRTNTWAQAIDQVAVQFSEIFTGAIDRAENFLLRLTDAFARFEWGDLFGADNDRGGLIGAFRAVFSRLSKVDWGRLWSNFKGGFARLVKRLTPFISAKWEAIKTLVQDIIRAWWTDVNWGQELRSLGRIAAPLWGAIQGVLSDTWDRLYDWFLDNQGTILLWIGRALLVGLGALLVAIGAVVLGVFVALVDLVAQGVEYVWNGLVDWFSYVIEDFVDWVGTTWDSFVAWFSRSAGGIGEAFSDVWEGIKRAVRGAVTVITSLVRGLISGITRLFPQTTQAISDVIDMWGERFRIFFHVVIGFWSSVFSTIGSALTSLYDSVLAPFFAWFSSAWEAVRQVASGVWTSITTAVAPLLEALATIPSRIQTAWSGIVQFLSPIFQRIATLLGPVARMFESMGQVGVRALDTIMSTAVRLFGGSINTIVGEDMQQTEEVMAQGATNISETMREVLYQATVDAIVQGFANGFQQVLEQMESFTGGMLASFTNLGLDVSNILTRLFVGVTEQMEALMQGMEATVTQIVSRLQVIRDANRELAEARANIEPSTASPADEAALQQRLDAMRGNEQLLAVHMPLWWNGPQGYRDLFIREMRDLRLAIASIQVTSGAGAGTTGVANARQRMEESRFGHPRGSGRNRDGTARAR